MTNLANLPPRGLKKPKLRRQKEYMAELSKRNCIICETFNMEQKSRTQVHHVIHDRHSTRRTPDQCAIPLCEGHHLGMLDTSKIAIHREPFLWRKEYGADYDYSSQATET